MNDRSMAVLFSYAVRAWKATTPELNGHRPQIAGNRNAERIARARPHPAKPKSRSPPHSCRMSPTGVRSGRPAPARGNGGPPSGRGAVLRVSGRTRPVTGDTTPYDQRPAELHNPRITQATYMSIWESAHLAGRRCRVEIRPPYRAPVPCGNPPTLPGAGAVWKSAHLAGRRCRVGIRPPCRAPVLCGNPPTLPGAGAVWESAHLAGRRCCVEIRPSS